MFRRSTNAAVLASLLAASSVLAQQDREGGRAGDAPPPPPPPRESRDGDRPRAPREARDTGRGDRPEAPPPPRRDGDRERDRLFRWPQQTPQIVAYLGVVTQPAEGALQQQLGLPPGVGLVVEHVEAGSPAEKAGVKQFDVLHKLDEQILVNPEQLRTLIHSRKKGEALKLTVIRHGQPQELTATLEEQTLEPPRSIMGYIPQPNMERANELIGEMREKLKEGSAKAADETAELLDKLSRELRDRRQLWFGPPPGDAGGPGVGPGVGPGGGPGGEHRRPDGAGPRGEFRRRDGDRRPEDGALGTTDAPSSVTATASYSDDDHKLTLTIEDLGRNRSLKATDKEGQVVFEGPVNTPEERQKVPEAIRPKLERLENQARLNIRMSPPSDVIERMRMRRFEERRTGT